MGRYPRSFFERYTPSVAKDLLGCKLVRVIENRRLAGIVVETEAYRGRRDPASHAYRGRTRRTDVMFEEAGHAYVYFVYGNNWCLNITTEPKGVPGAVLIRAIAPVEGVGAMVKNRGPRCGVHIADGPGRLTKALAIDGHFNGEDLVASKVLFMERGTRPTRIERSTRVGVSRGGSFLWRFFIPDSKFVSRGKFDTTQNP